MASFELTVYDFLWPQFALDLHRHVAFFNSANAALTHRHGNLLSLLLELVLLIAILNLPDLIVALLDVVLRKEGFLMVHSDHRVRLGN